MELNSIIYAIVLVSGIILITQIGVSYVNVQNSVK